MARRPSHKLPTLRGRVLALVAVVALLLLSLTGFSVWLVQQAALDRARISLIGQARTLAAAVDHEFRQGMIILQTLAGSDSLARHDLERFETVLRRTVDTFTGSGIRLIGPDGTILLSTGWEPGERPSDRRAGQTSLRALADGQPSFSNLNVLDTEEGPMIGVAVPVVIPGAATPGYVLAGHLPRRNFSALVSPSRLADGLTGVVFDRDMRFVARTGDDVALVGQPAPPDLRRAAQHLHEGAVPGLMRNVNGDAVVVAFARAPLSGYVACASVPAEAFAAPFRAALWGVVPIGAAITATGLIAALAMGRRLGTAIGALSALGRGEAATDTGFREVEEVAATLRWEAKQRAQAEARQAVLVAELNHRVKNMLASVQSVADQTLRNAGTDPKRFSEDFRGRLRSLGRAHDLLTQAGWKEAKLGDVLRAALSPWQGTSAEGQIRVEGHGDFVVSPRQAQALVLALHELATNASKYGALSVPGGFVRLRHGVAPDGRAEIFWQEIGGPPVPGPPSRTGFGTRLLQRGLPTDLGQAPTVSLDFAPGGVQARIAFVPARSSLPGPIQEAALSSTQS